MQKVCITILDIYQTGLVNLIHRKQINRNASQYNAHPLFISLFLHSKEINFIILAHFSQVTTLFANLGCLQFTSTMTTITLLGGGIIGISTWPPITR